MNYSLTTGISSALCLLPPVSTSMLLSNVCFNLHALIVYTNYHIYYQLLMTQKTMVTLRILRLSLQTLFSTQVLFFQVLNLREKQKRNTPLLNCPALLLGKQLHDYDMHLPPTQLSIVPFCWALIFSFSKYTVQTNNNAHRGSLIVKQSKICVMTGSKHANSNI